MGTYTTIRADVVIKPEHRVVIARLHQINEEMTGKLWYPGCCWIELAKEFPDLPFLDVWAEVRRCAFIPFGALSGTPDSFSPRGEWYSDFDYTSGRWQFCCSLKNYGGEIQFFVPNVLRPLIESATMFDTLYEEDDQHRDLLPQLR